MRLKALLLAALLASSAFVAAGAAKADAITTFGDTTGNGPFLLTSDSGVGNGYSSFDVHITTPLTFGQLVTLSANFVDNLGGDVGGSPRFSIGLQNGANENFVHVLLGTSPNFNDVDPAAFTLANSNLNVIGNNDAGRYDDSQFAGGSPFTDYSSTLALLSSSQVLDLFFVLDGGWARTQSLTLNSLNINGVSYDQLTKVAVPEPKTWTMMILGFAGAVGFTAYRRRKQSNGLQMATA